MLYDVFICHASEDKDAFVRPLSEELIKSHLEVWYDEFSLVIGDSLRESIDKGLAKSRYGVVVISQSFFKKRWPQRELNGLIAREMSENNSVILPIWHEITKEEILKYSPPLADLKAAKSSSGLKAVCRDLLRKLQPKESPLIVARDELLYYGLNPPVVTDEWWLNVVEASNRISNGGAVIPESSQWGRWTFPLPYGEGGEERGVRLAWTAMQMQWEKDAEEKEITQITSPEDVLTFIDSHPGLKEVCHEFPLILANYAPQLTIRGFGGEFEQIFNKMLKQSVKKCKKYREENSNFGTALTTNKLSPACDEEIALRHPTFGDYEPASIACQYVQGQLFGPQTRYYNHFDYLVWFLSEDSNWLPERIHNFLVEGMKTWTVWPTAGDLYNKFLKSIWMADSIKEFKLSKGTKNSLLSLIKKSLKTLELEDDGKIIRDKFLEFAFIESFFEEKNRRHRKK